MKQFIPMMIAAMLLCLPFHLSAQSENPDPILSIFNKYEDKDGVESITISPSLLGLMKTGKTNDKKTQDLVAKILGLRILSISDKADQKENPLREQLLAELKPVLNKDYEQFLKVKSEGDRVELYIKKNAGKNSNQNSALLFITSESRSVTVMHLAGIIDKELIDAVMNGEIGTSTK